MLDWQPGPHSLFPGIPPGKSITCKLESELQLMFVFHLVRGFILCRYHNDNIVHQEYSLNRESILGHVLKQAEHSLNTL